MTVADVFRFGQMLMNGGEFDGIRILSPKTVALTTNHVGDLRPWGQTEYGWGFGVAVRNRVRDDGIGSAGTFGWNGGSGALYWVDPAEGVLAVLVTPSDRHPGGTFSTRSNGWCMRRSWSRGRSARQRRAPGKSR